jgi:hypothetical protein
MALSVNDCGGSVMGKGKLEENQEFRQLLINLLSNDKEVQGIVVSLSSKNAADSHLLENKEKKDAELAALKAEIRQLHDQIEKAGKDKRIAEENATGIINDINKKLSIGQKELSDTKSELEKSRELMCNINNENNALKNRYVALDELEKIYAVYNTLPQNIKTSMAGFIRGDTLLSFVVSGMRDSRLDIFWEFCRTEVQKSDGLQYASQIESVFAFFFAKINGVTESPLYELLVPDTGRRFDDNLMILSNSSGSKDGVVEKTVLSGYSGKISQKIIKKAVVTLK